MTPDDKEVRPGLPIWVRWVFVVGLALEVVFLIRGRYVYLTNWGSGAQAASGYLAFLAAGFGLITTTVLVYVTAYYVYANDALVRIAAEQNKRAQTQYVEFGLHIFPPDAEVSVWLANLGVTNFMLADVEYLVSSPDDSPTSPELHPVNFVIATGGGVINVPMPHSFAQFGTDVQIRLRTRFLGEEKWTGAKGYNVVGVERAARRVTPGYHRTRGYECPKCHRAPWLMLVNGIDNEEELRARKAEYLSELAATCPEHDSQYMLLK